MTTQNTEDKTDPGISPNLAAQMCANALGESETVWALRLTNWRRPERRSPIKWRNNEVGRPVYDFDEVQAFIDTSLTQRMTATPAGAELGQAKASASADVEGNVPFVRVLWNAATAQGAFSLSPKAARDLAAKLIQAADKTAGRML